MPSDNEKNKYILISLFVVILFIWVLLDKLAQKFAESKDIAKAIQYLLEWKAVGEPRGNDLVMWYKSASLKEKGVEVEQVTDSAGSNWIVVWVKTGNAKRMGVRNDNKKVIEIRKSE